MAAAFGAVSAPAPVAISGFGGASTVPTPASASSTGAAPAVASFGGSSAAPGPSATSTSTQRGNTLFPHARNFLAGLRNIAAYGPTQRTLDGARFKEMYFDGKGKCEDYFGSLLDDTRRDATARQQVSSGQVPGVEAIDAHRIQTVLRMSDELDLNELSCLDYYIASQRNPELLQALEVSDASKGKDYYNLLDAAKVEEAPRDLYLYERQTTLDGLLLLMRMYVETRRMQAEGDGEAAGEGQEQGQAFGTSSSDNNGNGSSSSCYQVVLSMGNALLNGKKLTSRLIAVLRKRYVALIARNLDGQKQLGQQSNRDYVVTALDKQDFSEMQTLATILFYALEFDPAAEHAVQPLQELIFLISKDLTKSNDFLLSVDGAETINSWQVPAQTSLIMLQLAHFSAVDRLTDRCFEAEDAGEPEPQLKNLLFTLAGELYAESGGIGCHSAYGVALLAFAQFLREAGRPPAGIQAPEFVELIYQVNEGDSCLGTYSYIRLCVLPLLQARSGDPVEAAAAAAAGGLSQTHADLFGSLLKLLDALACTCLDSLDRFGDTTISDIGSLFAATFAVKPSYAKQFHPRDAGGAFDPFAVQLLSHTMRAAGSKLNAVSLHLLAGLCGGPREAENVYRLLDSTPQAANPNAITKLTWQGVLSFVQKCADYVSKIQDVHEKVLVGVFSVLAAVASRSSAAAISLLRDYRPLPLLFQLLAVPVSITLKGAIYRALAAFARVPDAAAASAGAAAAGSFGSASGSVHEDIWSLIESYRLLPTYGIGRDASAAMSAISAAGGMGGSMSGSVGVSVSNSLTGLRLELEDSEAKEGLYSITDGFLQLLEALLSQCSQDSLGSRYRPPGIIVYLEYVIEDVLIKAKERYFTVGPQGRAQRWRLVARCLKVLIAVLQHYPINALEILQRARVTTGASDASGKSDSSKSGSGGGGGGGGGDDDEVLASLESDFREECVSYTVNGQLQHDQPRIKSAGFFVMALLLSSTSRLREQLLLLLQQCDADVLRAAWHTNAEAAAKQALRMGEILAHKTRQSSFLDNRLGFHGYDGGICDGCHWMSRTVTAAVGLLYECSLREAAFVRHFRAAPYLTVLRVDNGRLVSTPVTVHGLADILCVSSSALVRVSKLLAVPAVFSSSVPSVPHMAARLLKMAATDLPALKLLGTVNGQLAHARYVEGGGSTSLSMRARLRELQSGCLDALSDSSRLPVHATYETRIMALGSDITVDVFSTETAPVAPPDAEQVMRELKRTLAVQEESGSRSSSSSSTGSEFESTSEAVLDLLLTTLAPDQECLSHLLLGLLDSLDGTRVPRWDLRLAADGPGGLQRGELPSTCLDLVLYRLEDTAELLETEPELACLCFELLYRLCASPITSVVMLAFLRKYDVLSSNSSSSDSGSEKFLASCLRQCLHVLRLPDERSPAAATAADGSSDPDSGSSSSDSEAHAWGKVRSSRAICTGWLLRICALELRSLGLLRESGALLPLHLQPFLELYATDVPFAGYNMNFLEVLLLRACGSSADGNNDDVQASAAEEVTPLVSRCLTAATRQYRIGRHPTNGSGSGSGDSSTSTTAAAGSFTAIDKQAFIQQFFSEVDETEFQDRAGEYRGGVQLLVHLNRRYRDIAANAHLAEGWRHFTSVFVVCHSEDLISRRDAAVGKKDLEDYVGSLLLPVLRTLRERAGRLSAAVKESIASTLLLLVRELGSLPRRRVCTAIASTAAANAAAAAAAYSSLAAAGAAAITSTLPVPTSSLALCSHALLGNEDTATLLDDLISLALQSGGGGGSGGLLLPSGDSSAVKFRGLVYTSLTSVLTHLCSFPASLNGKVEVLSNATSSAASSGSNGADAAIRALAARTLCKHAAALADVLGRDACSGPLLWRLNACAALSQIMVVAGPPGVRTVTQVLIRNGFMHQLLTTIDSFQSANNNGGFDNSGSAAALHGLSVFHPHASEAAAAAHSLRAQREMLVSVVGLCTHVASTREGAEALLEHGGLLQRLNTSKAFAAAPHGLDALVDRDNGAGAAHEWLTQLLPVLRLLCVLAAKSPSREVLLGVATFLRSNRDSVVFVLRLRLRSLAGLLLAECLTSLLAAVASAAPTQHRGNIATATTAVVVSGSQPQQPQQSTSQCLWDMVFGPELGAQLLSDCSGLLRLIGGDPFPPELARKYGASGSGSSGDGAFWDHVQPASGAGAAAEDERRLAGLRVADSNEHQFLAFPRDWTAFDHSKLDLSLKIAAHVAALLRMRTHVVIESSFRSSSSSGSDEALHKTLDLRSAVLAFCRCSALSRKCVVVSGSSHQQQLGEDVNQRQIGQQQQQQQEQEEQQAGTTGGSSANAMISAHAALLCIAENLLAALHDAAMANHPDWAPGLLDAVLQEALLPGGGSNSDGGGGRHFINELGRVMRRIHQ